MASRLNKALRAGDAYFVLSVIPVLAIALWLLTNSYVALTDPANEPTLFSLLLTFSLLLLPFVSFYLLARAIGTLRGKGTLVIISAIAITLSLVLVAGMIGGSIGFPEPFVASVPQYSCTSYPNATGFNYIQSCTQTGTSSAFRPAFLFIDLLYWAGIVCLLAADQIWSMFLPLRAMLELKVASALYVSALLTPILSLGIQLGSEIFAWSQRYGLPVFAYEYMPSLCPSVAPTAHWCYVLSPTYTLADFLFWSALVFFGSLSTTLLYRRHGAKSSVPNRAPA